jgi:hypothetical protein
MFSLPPSPSPSLSLSLPVSIHLSLPRRRHSPVGSEPWSWRVDDGIDEAMEGGRCGRTERERSRRNSLSPLPAWVEGQNGGPLCMGKSTYSSNPHIKSFPLRGKWGGKPLQADSGPKWGRWIYVKAKADISLLEPTQTSLPGRQPLCDWWRLVRICGRASESGAVTRRSRLCVSAAGSPTVFVAFLHWSACVTPEVAGLNMLRAETPLG